MKKTIIALITASLCSTSFAFHIVSEKLTCKGAVKCEITPHIYIQKKTPLFARAVAQVTGNVVKVNTTGDVTGNHSVSIINNTSAIQRYSYTYTLTCLDGMESFVGEVDFNPGEAGNVGADTHLTVQPHQVGVFDIFATTNVSGESHDDAQGKGYLTAEE